MKQFKFFSILIMLLSLVIMSCKKETQEAPPEAQVTIQNMGNGITERTQRGGPNGGTVTYSNWIHRENPDWTGFGTLEVVTDFFTTTLNQAMIDNGIILMYYKVNNEIRLMPAIFLEYPTIVIENSISVGKLTAHVKTADLPITSLIPVDFRYILVHGTSLDGGRMNLDYNDYNAVAEYYGLPKE